jgi:uncharacterized membrane protein YfcA
MTVELVLAISCAILVIAFLYSSVGHAGASGYIAVMTLFGLAPAHIKPAALLLNILVACLTTWQFWKAGFFSWKLFWPFGIASVPFAFLGGYLALPTHIFRIVIGIVLLYSALRFFVRPKPDDEPTPPGRTTAMSLGAGLGLLSGLTGVGGGIFLTPLLIFMGWARTKTAAAVSALFILVNSISGLSGNISGTQQLPFFALPFAMAATAGGVVGSYLGSRRLSPVSVKKLLGVVLAIAGMKLIFA